MPLTLAKKSAVVSCGLDPMLGNLHELTYGQVALVLDLMEEFRVPVADTLTCSLFNKNVLREGDFREADVSGKKGVYLTAAGAKKACCMGTADKTMKQDGCMIL